MLWERPQAGFTSAKDVMSLPKTWLKEIVVKFDLKPYVNHTFLYSNEEQQAALELIRGIKKQPENKTKQ